MRQFDATANHDAKLANCTQLRNNMTKKFYYLGLKYVKSRISHWAYSLESYEAEPPRINTPPPNSALWPH